jgi:hypothetical protein
MPDPRLQRQQAQYDRDVTAALHSLNRWLAREGDPTVPALVPSDLPPNALAVDLFADGPGLLCVTFTLPDRAPYAGRVATALLDYAVRTPPDAWRWTWRAGPAGSTGSTGGA